MGERAIDPNSTYIMRALKFEEAEALFDRPSIYPNEPCETVINIQPKTDIFRINLLHKFGFVWADASIFCNAPFKFTDKICNAVSDPNKYYRFH